MHVAQPAVPQLVGGQGCLHVACLVFVCLRRQLHRSQPVFGRRSRIGLAVRVDGRTPVDVLLEHVQLSSSGRHAHQTSSGPAAHLGGVLSEGHVVSGVGEARHRQQIGGQSRVVDHRAERQRSAAAHLEVHLAGALQIHQLVVGHAQRDGRTHSVHVVHDALIVAQVLRGAGIEHPLDDVMGTGHRHGLLGQQREVLTALVARVGSQMA